MISRRRFLTHSCKLGVATAALSSSVLQLGLARSLAAQPAEEYRALVCILLAGGNDSYNMVVPMDQDQYAQYQEIRSDLALARERLLPLSGTTLNGRSYAVHPGMSEVQSLFNRGELAVVANTGTLLEPFDAIAMQNGTAKVPLGLFSHSDQIAQWQTAVSDDRTAHGWAGRIGDLRAVSHPSNGISMNISLSGTNVFQSGQAVAPYAVEAKGDGAPGIIGYDDGTEFGRFRKRMIDNLLGVQQTHLLRKEYRRELRAAIDNQQIFAAALAASPDIETEFSVNQFSQGLRRIARVISARDMLGARRQTFFITLGGWDHHDELLNNQARMLPIVSNGLQEFRNALFELGLFDQVTSFTISDFGRTLTSNGKGSDHGWGGHQLVMGGAVNGGRIYGQYPEIFQGNLLDVGRGVYAPTTSVDEYFAELALWFGVSPGELDFVLPNVGRFYSPSSGTSPLGFLRFV